MENRNAIVNGVPMETEHGTTAGSLMERLGADLEDWVFEKSTDSTSSSKARPINHAVYIPERFRQAIELHIIKNMLAGRDSIQTPLLLGIHGPTGVGKTYQCECVLTEMGIASFLISGGQLESPNAGEPAQLIRTTYKRASDAMHNKECVQAVILINDFDTACGNWGELVQYTVNRQTIFSELMHLTDYPHSVEGRTVARIPIILTGNNFTRLYSPPGPDRQDGQLQVGANQRGKSNYCLTDLPQIAAERLSEAGRSFCKSTACLLYPPGINAYG